MLFRTSAVRQVGLFSLWALVEDMDMAFKLNEAGYRVEQSMHFVLSEVPATLKTWYRQKMRWNG